MNRRKLDFATSLYKMMQTSKFSDISISDMCKEMNCSRQSFYYYFKSLDDCLTYYIKELGRVRIKEEHLITDTFTLVEESKALIRICENDNKTQNIFWSTIATQLKKQLDVLLSKSLVDYLSLYPEQKDILICFYVSGIINEAKRFYAQGFTPCKEKYVEYCKAILGDYENMRTITKRFVKI